MQNLQDLEEKIFFETKNILATLSRIDTKEELFLKHDLVSEMTDRLAFLRILKLNKSFFDEDQNTEIVEDKWKNENQFKNSENEFSEVDLIEEEVEFTNEINNIREENEGTEEEELITEDIIEPEFQTIVPETIENIETVTEREIPLIVEQEEPDYKDRVFQKEQEFLASEERRRNIVEITKENHPQSLITEPFHEEKVNENVAERKFKLANIKGLKTVQNLFDEDPLDKIVEQELEIKIDHSSTGSLQKANMQTDFMEAPKKAQEFRLDFNDHMAFTKLLFKGDETDLKNTIAKLNSYTNIEDARQYLSEIYYQKDWNKADEYAQRLWNLVENKFM